MMVRVSALVAAVVCGFALLAERVLGAGSVSSGSFTLDWEVNGDFITMTMSTTQAGKYLSVAYNTGSSGHTDADSVVGWINGDGSATVFDAYDPSGRSRHNADPSQDITGVSSSVTGGVTSITFTRPLVTGDSSDNDIVDGMRVYYATGNFFGSGTTQYSEHSSRANMGLVNFLLDGSDGTDAPSQSPTDSPSPSPTSSPVGTTVGSVEDAVSGFLLEWERRSASITFTMSGPADATGYVGMGISNGPSGHSETDSVIGWINGDGSLTVFDAFDLSGKNRHLADASQDITDVSGALVNGVLSITYTRPLVTGDAADNDVEDDMSVFWALGSSFGSGTTAYAEHTERGKIGGTVDFLTGGDTRAPTSAPVVTTIGGVEDAGSGFALDWVLRGDEVTFTASGPAGADGYVGVGFGTGASGHSDTDSVVGWVNDDGSFTVFDAYDPSGQDRHLADASQDIFDVSAERVNGVLSITYTRLLATGDAEDKDVQDGMRVFWALGSFSGAGTTAYAQHDARGSIANVDLLSDVSPLVPDENGIVVGTFDSNGFKMRWETDAAAGTVSFELQSDRAGYIGVGLGESDGSSFHSSDNPDVVGCWVSGGNGVVTDGTAKSSASEPNRDAQQDWTITAAAIVNGVTTCTVVRDLVTGDPNDQDLNIGPQTMWYAKGTNSANGNSFVFGHQEGTGSGAFTADILAGGEATEGANGGIDLVVVAAVVGGILGVCGLVYVVRRRGSPGGPMLARSAGSVTKPALGAGSGSGSASALGPRSSYKGSFHRSATGDSFVSSSSSTKSKSKTKTKTKKSGGNGDYNGPTAIAMAVPDSMPPPPPGADFEDGPEPEYMGKAQRQSTGFSRFKERVSDRLAFPWSRPEQRASMPWEAGKSGERTGEMLSGSMSSISSSTGGSSASSKSRKKKKKKHRTNRPATSGSPADNVVAVRPDGGWGTPAPEGMGSRASRMPEI